jgi:hypothetical protein
VCRCVFRCSAIFGCSVFHSILLCCLIFSSILNSMFIFIQFRYRNLFPFTLVCQFQSVQFCHTLFHLLSTFITKCISIICISSISCHFRKVVLGVKFQDRKIQRAYQYHFNIDHTPTTKNISGFSQTKNTHFFYFILTTCFRRLTIIRPSLQNSE